MAEHRATVEWRAAGGAFRDNRYSRAHRLRFDGGADVPASASPQVVPEPLSDPAGVDPEEMLIASAASCHMLWFLDLARQAGLEVAAYRDEATGTLGRGADGRVAISRIVLRPKIEFSGDSPDAATLGRLHHDAHERCFIANSLKTEILVEPA
ncbi:MAG: OsmC family protein [Alphaproteobacteria bacterium]|nr:OsmC family protein [Alphaproteobacteria bacterium]